MKFDKTKFAAKEAAKEAAGARRIARMQERTKRRDRKSTLKENTREQRRRVKQTISRGATLATMTDQYKQAEIAKNKTQNKVLANIAATLQQYNKLITGDPNQDSGDSTSNPFSGWGE